MTTPITIAEAKDRATRLRAVAARNGRVLSQAAALERIARRAGHRNWNTLRAAAPAVDPKAPTRHGARVAGRYLGREFAGRVVRIAPTADGWRVTVLFDAPVDVGRLPAFPVLRRRVSVEVDAGGASFARTSDGRPHLTLAKPVGAE